MKKGYCGMENAFRYILDISGYSFHDYDGCGDNPKELKELIDEIQDICIKALKYKDKFYVPMYSSEDFINEETNKNLKDVDNKNK